MQNDAAAISVTRPVMTEAEYDRERTRIRETFGHGKTQAGVRQEQTLATLFFRSGWNQKQLAKKEGKTEPWVTYQLRLARYVNQLTSVNSVENPAEILETLSEGRFRKHYDLTDKMKLEPARFNETTVLLKASLELQNKRSKDIGKAIRAKCMDGKWRTVAEIAELVAKPEDDIAELEILVAKILKDAAGRKNRASFQVEKQQRRGTEHFRIIPKINTVSSDELTEKLRPIIDTLMVEGKKPQIRRSGMTLLTLAHDLKEYLDEWTR